jgi:hypothetical protein
MRLRADDDIYRARLVYLGPPGYTLPIHATYPQIFLFAGVAALFLLIGSLLFSGWGFFGSAIALSFITTYGIWRHVDADVPVRKVLLAAFHDCRRAGPRTEPSSNLPKLTGRHIIYRATIITEDKR